VFDFAELDVEIRAVAIYQPNGKGFLNAINDAVIVVVN